MPVNKGQSSLANIKLSFHSAPMLSKCPCCCGSEPDCELTLQANSSGSCCTHTSPKYTSPSLVSRPISNSLSSDRSSMFQPACSFQLIISCAQSCTWAGPIKVANTCLAVHPLACSETLLHRHALLARRVQPLANWSVCIYQQLLEASCHSLRFLLLLHTAR
jgi:hypothetical protein